MIKNINYIKREEFMWDYMEKNIIPKCYEKLQINKKNIYSKKDSLESYSSTPLVLYVYLFPSFIQSKILNSEHYACKKIIHQNYSGAGNLLKEGYTIDSYLNEFYTPKFRTNIKRYLNRLESAFNIKYEISFGDISIEKYNFLIGTLYEMLKKRFEQKEITNHVIANWEKNIKDLYALINKKKASLFVIYDNEKPINICLSYHNEAGLRFIAITGYDIDYSKFGIGHISQYKKLEWCLNNNYCFMDLGQGVFGIKNEWCNEIYDFEYHIYYRKKSMLAFLIAHYELLKIRAKNFIKYFKNKTLVKKPQRQKLTPPFLFQKLNSDSNYQNIEHIAVDINNASFEFLRHPVYTYLFLNNEHIDNVKIFKISNELNTYLIEGKSSLVKLTLNN